MNIKKTLFLIMIFALTLSPAYAADKGADPVAYWRFDEGGGPTAYDSSGSNHGTLQPGAGGSNLSAGQMWTRQGNIGGALECDGTDDYVNVTPTASLHPTQFTVTAWVKVTALGADSNIGTVVFANYSGLKDFIFYISNTGLLGIRTHDGTTSYDLKSTDSITTGNWYFIGTTFDGTNLIVYINGVNKGSRTATNMSLSSNPVIIGRASHTAGNYFNGLIDDVRIYNYARTAAQILVDYNAGAAAYLGGGTDPNEGNPPLAYYKFDEDSGNAAYDKSGNGYDLSLSGTEWVSGKYGSALRFNGDTVTNGTLLDTVPSALTLEAWFKLSSNLTSNREILRKQNAGGERLCLYLRSTTDGTPYGITFDTEAASGGYTALAATSKWHLGEWIHLAVTWDATNGKRIYVNGALENSDATKTTLMGNGTLGDFLVGSSGFTGDIDDVKIYAYARTPAQIAYDYSKGKPVAHYRFDEGGGAIAHNDYSSSDAGLAPVGWWRMDNNLTDSSGNGTTGTAEGGATFSTSAKIGPYCIGTLDGVDDDINLSNSNTIRPTSQVTWEAWIKPTNFTPTDSGQWNGILDCYGTSNTRWQVRGSTYGQMSISDLNIGGVARSSGSTPTGSIVVNEWHHVAMTYDGNYIRQYINGVLQSTSSQFTGSIDWGAGNVYIGGHEGITRFKGLIDDVRIYNYARTAEQIYNDYKTTHGTLVGDTKFVDGKIGKALQFDGTGDRVDCGTDSNFNFGTGDFTIGAWIKTTQSDTDYKGIVSKYYNGTGPWILLSPTNRYVMFGWDGSNYLTGDESVNDGNWHYIVAQRTGSTSAKIYIDGHLDVESDTEPTKSSDTTVRLDIGRMDIAGRDFTGLIDDVRIYNYARTSEQIQQDCVQGLALDMGRQLTGIADPWGGALPVAHWKLDENTGVLARDASENNNNGTLGGDGAGTDVPTWTQGKKGPCLSFDGQNDYAKVNNHSSLSFGLNDITVSLWFKVNAGGKTQRMIHKGVGIGRFIIGVDSSNHLQVNSYFGPGLDYWMSSSVDDVNDLAWHNFLMVFDRDGYQTMYLDGIYKTRASISAASAVSWDSSSHIYIGAESGTSNYADALIDDVRIYNYALTQAQVAYLYNRGAPVAHWRFDEAISGAVSTTAGAIKSDSGSYNGTASATTFSYAAGKFGGALNFDGNDYVSIGNLGSFPTAGSISFWINATEMANYRNPFTTKRVGGNAGIRFEENAGGTFGVVIGNDAGTYASHNYFASGMQTSRWYHVSVVWDTSANNVKGYLDGALIFNDSHTLWPTTLPDLAVGTGFTADAARQWYGLVDDVRIYNYARTAEQVMQDYNQGMAARLGD